MGRLLFLALTLLLYPSAAAAETSIIGILEQPQCAKEKKRSARILFGKTDLAWRALDSVAVVKQLNVDSLKWTIALDGRSVGTIRIADANPSATFVNPWFYMRDKLFEVPAGQPLPAIKNTSQSFGGWCHVPEYRPLVLVSRPSFADPDGWKPFVPEAVYRQKLRIPLKLVIGRFKAFRCLSEDRTEPFEFQPNDLVLDKSYRSASGKQLISIGLDLKKIRCDGPPEAAWSRNWFLLDGDDLEFLGNQLVLLC